MRNSIKIPTNKFYTIIISCAVIIFMVSLDVMMKVKDINLFELWYTTQSSELINISKEEAFNVYVVSNLSVYLSRIITTIAFGIYVYFAYIKLEINKLFIFLWTVLIIGSLLINAVSFELYSIYYYIILVSHIVLIFTILSLTNDFEEVKDKGE